MINLDQVHWEGPLGMVTLVFLWMVTLVFLWMVTLVFLTPAVGLWMVI